MTWPILSVTTFLPLLGALAILLFARSQNERDARAAQIIAMLTSGVTFAVSLLLLRDFDPQNTGMQFVERVEWLPQLGISYFRGIDGISIWFVLISTLLTPICILSAFSGITKRVPEFMIAMLALETMMIGMFTALDLVLVLPGMVVVCLAPR